MTTLEQRIEAVERAEEYYRESMGPRPLISSPDVRVYDALRDAAETLRAMQWRYDMENAPEGVPLWISYESEEIGSLKMRRDVARVDSIGGLAGFSRGLRPYAWMVVRPLPTPAPLPQGEGG